jgi:FAD/FMN-containing dehydrogenase
LPAWKESWNAALNIRRELSERLFELGACALSRGMGSGVAPYVMPKLGSYYDVLRALKKTLDPNEILNPGIFCLSVMFLIIRHRSFFIEF